MEDETFYISMFVVFMLFMGFVLGLLICDHIITENKADDAYNELNTCLLDSRFDDVDCYMMCLEFGLGTDFCKQYVFREVIK